MFPCDLPGKEVKQCIHRTSTLTKPLENSKNELKEGWTATPVLTDKLHLRLGRSVKFDQHASFDLYDEMRACDRDRPFVGVGIGLADFALFTLAGAIFED